MAEEITYSSSIAEWITGFVREKKSLGYSYYNESKWMRLFDSYWIAHGYDNKIGLTPETLSDWVIKRKTEGEKCLATRVSVIRQFAKYLNGLGIPGYCPPIKVHYQKAVIHLPAPDEISEFFEKVDSYSPGKGSTDIRRIGNEYPVLFRLIYLNGLRASEACFLAQDNIDLDTGIVSILDGKGNRDRLVYLSDDMVDLCRNYTGYIKETINRKPIWFFPGLNPDDPISYGSVSAMFRRCWQETSFAPGCDRNPTTHCLRHAYVVNRINLWREQGMDFEHMIPYLSRFLGHKSFDETYYYYHYAEETARTIRNKDTIIDRVIPEVMRR